MLYRERPANFSSEKAGAICFLEWNGTFLLMKRAHSSYQGGLWTAAPGGKLEPGESPLEGVIREIREETGICRSAEQIEFIQTVYYQFADIEYALHLFYSHMTEKPTVNLEAKEHTEYAWETLQQALMRPIMRGGNECIELVLEWINSKSL